MHIYTIDSRKKAPSRHPVAIFDNLAPFAFFLTSSPLQDQPQKYQAYHQSNCQENVA